MQINWGNKTLKKNEKKIVETTLYLLKKKGWNDTALSEIKKKSKIKDFDRIIKDKKSIVPFIHKYFDYKLILEIENVEKSNNKDMIFEILMMRFDILQNHRKAVISIFNSIKNNPKDLILLLPNVLDSIILMTKHTNISVIGIKGQLKIKGILIIYINSFFVWMKDQTTSLDKTMNSIDKSLDQASIVLKYIK